MTITDDFCQDLTTKILNIIEGEVSLCEEDWGTIHEKVFELLALKLESNGYVNYN